MRGTTLTTLILIVLLAGCGRVSEKAINEVLEKDPSFSEILKAKKNINSKIISLEENFKKEKDSATAKILAAKENIREKKKALSSQILSLKGQMDPKILTLKAKLDERRSEYTIEAKELSVARAKLKNMTKLLNKKKELSLSGDEITIWTRRIENLKMDIASYSSDLDKIKSRIRTLELEIRISSD